MIPRMLITVFTLIGVIITLILPGITPVSVAASPAINTNTFEGVTQDHNENELPGDIIKSVMISVSDESYHVDFTEFALNDRVKAIVTLTNGLRVSYGSMWKSFTLDQVLANAIGRKDKVAQAVALAAGAVPPITPGQVTQSSTPVVKPVDVKPKPVEKPGNLPGINSTGDGSDYGSGNSSSSGSSLAGTGSGAAGAGVNTVGAGGAVGAGGTIGGTVGAGGGAGATSPGGSNSGPGSANSGPGSGDSIGSNSGSGSNNSGSGSDNSGSGSSGSDSGSSGSGGSGGGSGSGK